MTVPTTPEKSEQQASRASLFMSLGSLAAMAAVTLGLMGITAGGESCGSVFFPYDDSFAEYLGHDPGACADARGSRLVLVVLCAFVATGLWTTAAAMKGARR